MKKAYSYARFSNSCQTGGNSLERQLQIATDWYNREIKPLGISLDALDSDTGYSAYKGDHVKAGRGLGDFLIEINEGRIDRGSILICENLDRISRQGPKIARKLLEQIVDAGVDVHVVNISKKLVLGWEDGLSTSVVVDVELGRALKESQYKSDRIGTAWKSKKLRSENGEVMTEVVPWWLEVVGRKVVSNKVFDTGKIVPNEEKTRLVQEMFRLATLGLGSKMIIRRLGLTIPLSTVGHTLRNRRVLGEHIPSTKGVRNGNVIHGYYPRVVTQEEFDAARKAIELRCTERSDIPCRGGARNSDDASNLFSGLLFDITLPDDTRGMQFAIKGKKYKHSYLTSAWRAGKKAHRVCYEKFEKAFLGFLSELDWKAVAGQSETNDLKQSSADLDKVTADIVKLSSTIDKFNAAFNDPESNVAVLSRKIGEAEGRLADLMAQKKTLFSKIEEAREKCASLYTEEALLDLIRQNSPAANDLRLRLKAEIRKRILRLDFVFGTGGLLVYVRFVNGADRMIDFRNAEAILAYQRSWERGELK